MKGGDRMATFINLLRFSQQGAGDLKESPARLDALKQGIRALGVELKVIYFLMGQYDALVIIEAPDDETALKATLATFSAGGISTETLRAFTEEEFMGIIATMP